ncbi:hypothetical protein [Flexithrix dorotheae]|uniref:hypothetical protein n=1 Tax=Flexithrix dorotheae TaxID=70993 RepID=UPI00038109BA|nr:hypothetical protein [Flexithrix dorotheae]
MKISGFFLLFFILPFFPLLAQNGFLINDGEKATNREQVTLHLNNMLAQEVMVSNDFNFSGASWVAYSPNLQWNLSPLDGKKEVYLKFRDKNGNESITFRSSIILDTQPPTNCEISLHQGDNYLNYLDNIEVEMKANGARWMMVSENENFETARWVNYDEKYKYTFPEGDGLRTVYARFKDLAGNESEVVMDKIKLDTKPPEIIDFQIVSDGIIVDSVTNAKYLNQHNSLVDIEIKTKDAKFMRITNARAFYGLKWHLLDDYYEDWNLGNYKDGRYRVSAMFRDIASNETKAVSDEVIVDTAPPFNCKIAINGDKTYSVSEKMDITIRAVEARHMMVSDDPSFSNAEWEPYQSYKSWEFENSEGEKKIYAKFKDVAGNISAVVMDEILLDNHPPVNASLTINNGDESTVVAYVNVQVNAMGAEFMQVSNYPDFRGEIWKNYHTNPFFFKIPKEYGEKVIYARFKDFAGNISEPIQSSITLEVTPVMNNLVIDDYEQYCVNKERKVNLTLSSKSATEMMISNYADFADGQWEPFAREKEWQLLPEDGNKKVYAKFRSFTKTESQAVNDDIILDLTPPVAKTIKINEGKENTFYFYTNVEVTAEDAVLMQVSEDSTFKGVLWHGYTERKFNYMFTKIAGFKDVYARFMDQAGNISETISDRVKIEINPIRIAFFVDNNAEYCTDRERKVKLYFNAKSAVEMIISNYPDFKDAQWEPYQIKKDWILTEGDGVKTIYAKLRSATGVESPVITDDIMLDIEGPKNFSLQLERGKETTLKPYTYAELKATEAISMQISKYENFERAKWIPYSTKPLYIYLGKKGGEFTFYARFKDQAGNISEAVSDKIMMEIKPTVGKIVIDNHAKYCMNPNGEVFLDIFCADAMEMMVSNSPEFSGGFWEPYQKSKRWYLLEGEGEKSVFIKFKSKTQTESEVFRDQIVVDNIPPVVGNIKVNKNKYFSKHHHNAIGVTVDAKDAVYMQLSEYADFSGCTWTKYTDLETTFHLKTIETDKSVYARFKDEKGNISEAISATFQLDRDGPGNKLFTINNNESVTNKSEVTLYFNSKEASHTKIAHDKEKISEAQWVKYQDSIKWQLESSKSRTKQVTVQFKDPTGNVSKVYTSWIDLDNEPPINAMIEVENGGYCNNQFGFVDLKIHAEGATKMMLSNNRDFEGAVWESFKQLKQNWILDDVDGTKIVYGKLADDAGNETQVSATIFLDREAPDLGKVSINSEALTTNKKKVVLNIQAQDATEMIISNNGLFGLPAKWRPFESTVNWKLEGLDGDKTVFVKVKDKAGNISTLSTATIDLDTEAPVVHSFELNHGETALEDGPGVTLVIKSKQKNGMPDAKFIQVSNSPSFGSGTWEPFYEEVPWSVPSGPGLHNVYIILKDEAGNVTLPFKDEIMVY